MCGRAGRPRANAHGLRVVDAANGRRLGPRRLSGANLADDFAFPAAIHFWVHASLPTSRAPPPRARRGAIADAQVKAAVAAAEHASTMRPNLRSDVAQSIAPLWSARELACPMR